METLLAAYADTGFRVELYDVFPFVAWTILCDGLAVQEGASLSESSARIDSHKIALVLAGRGVAPTDPEET